jgi:hypothetical protein
MVLVKKSVSKEQEKDATKLDLSIMSWASDQRKKQ